ncbi:hypothetical protein Hanom_Chr09g00803091 [Helianthus anomalus]
MTKIPEPDGYARNPTQMGWVYPIPDGYWAGYRISFKKFCRYGSGTGLGVPDPITRNHIPVYPNYIPDLIPEFINLYLNISLTLVY